MANYSKLVPLVRRKVGFPEPEAGGDDKLSNDVIIEYLNNAFDQMCDTIYGFDRYVEFTITAAGVITITDPTTNPPVVAVTADPVLGSYPVYTVSDARSYEGGENKTAAIADNYSRIMKNRPLDSPVLQTTYNSTTSYYRYFSVQGSRGFTLLPLTITETNTIGITYRRNFTRYAIGDVAFVGAGNDDLTEAGIYTVTDGTTNNYRVEIDSSGPDTFQWSNDGGATWEATGVAVATTATTLENGLTVTFAALLGHTVGDHWDWTATAPLLDVMREEDHRGFPVLRAAAECGRDLDEARYWYWLLEAQGKSYPDECGGLLLAFKDKNLTEDLLLNETLADPYDTGDNIF